MSPLKLLNICSSKNISSKLSSFLRNFPILEHYCLLHSRRITIIGLFHNILDFILAIFVVIIALIIFNYYNIKSILFVSRYVVIYYIFLQYLTTKSQMHFLYNICLTIFKCILHLCTIRTITPINHWKQRHYYHDYHILCLLLIVLTLMRLEMMKPMVMLNTMPARTMMEMKSNHLAQSFSLSGSLTSTTADRAFWPTTRHWKMRHDSTYLSCGYDE